MSAGMIVSALALLVVSISAFGVYRYGWINLGDELLCGLLVFVAFFLGSLAENGSLGATKAGGGFGPDLSGIAIFIFAPCALGVGLAIGALFPPWSIQEFAAVAVASVCALKVGYMASKR